MYSLRCEIFYFRNVRVSLVVHLWILNLGEKCEKPILILADFGRFPLLASPSVRAQKTLDATLSLSFLTSHRVLPLVLFQYYLDEAVDPPSCHYPCCGV